MGRDIGHPGAGLPPAGVTDRLAYKYMAEG
jgi:hypothetical protein